MAACEAVRVDLKAFVDGELPEDRAEEVRRAVESDPELQKELRSIEAIGTAIGNLATESPVRGGDALLEQVRRQPLPWWTRNKLVWSVPLYAGCLVLLIALVKPMFFASHADEAEPMPTASDSAAAPVSMASPKSPNFMDGKAMGGVDKAATKTSSSGVFALAPKQRDSVLLKAPTVGRRVIENAALEVTVESPANALTVAMNTAKANGGFVQDSSLERDMSGDPVANATLRVPVEKFSVVVKELKGLGPVTSDHVTGEDVTVQLADTEGRIEALEAEDSSYVLMLRNARKVQEALDVRSRLDEVRQELQSLRNQASTLKDLAAMSTIKAKFSVKPKPVHAAVVEPPQDWVKGTWADAMGGFFSLCRVLAQAAIYLLVYSPVWCALVALVWFGSRKRTGAGL